VYAAPMKFGAAAPSALEWSRAPPWSAMSVRRERGTFGSRGSLLSLTYIGLAIPVMGAGMLVGARLYALALGLKWGGEVPALHAIGVVIAMLMAIPIGLSLGGWLWVAVGRSLFQLTRSEVEAFVMRGPRIGPLHRYNEWCLKKLFGPGVADAERSSHTA
jgi:hypothetical protein